MKYEGRDEGRERERMFGSRKGRNEKETEKVFVVVSHIRLMLWIAQRRNVTSTLF